MKKVLSGTLSLVVAFATLGTLQVQAAPNQTDQLTPAASAAFADVGRCLTSGKSTELSVFYLIDSSGSLAWTDPDNERREILEGSIAGLGEFALEGIDVRVAAKSFSSSTSEILDWTDVSSPEEATSIASKIGKRINNQNIGGTTDWEEGLEEAYSELEEQSGCKMLIWFTDGGINPDNTYEGVEKSLAALCHPGVSIAQLGNSTSYGFMERFRNAQIPVFGILYSNLEKAAEYFEENYPGESASLVAEERWLMSFMKPLIEGSGEIPAEEFNGAEAASGSVKCAAVNADGVAPPEQTNGAFLNAEDPVGLAFQFLKLGSQISGGAANKVVDGKFEVPSGTAKFVLVLAGTDWTISGPEESGIQASNTSPNASVRARATSGATAVTVSVAGNNQAIGSWMVDPKDVAAELFLYPGLTFSLDRDASSKILSDFENTITGKVVRTAEFSNLPVNLEEYENASIAASVLEGGQWKPIQGATVESQPNGEFAITGFNPPAGSENVDVKLSLDLGPNFNVVESRFTLEVQDKGSLASASTDDLVLTPLVGPQGLAVGTIVLTGPALDSTSEFCFAEMMRLDDEQSGIEKIDRISSFVWKFTDLETGAEGPCFTLAENQEKQIQVSVANEIQAPAEVVSIWNITSKTEGVDAEFEAPLRIGFSSQIETNEGVKWLVLFALLLAGLLLPLAAMWLLNFLTTRFLEVQGMAKATYPVVINTQGANIQISDNRPTKSGRIVVEPRDFLGVMDEKPPRNYKLGDQGEARARVPYFPLAATWYEWVAPNQSRIITSNLRSSKTTKEMKQAKAVEVSPNLSENWAFTVTDSKLMSGNKDSFEATLTVLSPMSDLKGYQARVDKILSSNGLRQAFANAREAAVAEFEASLSKTDDPSTSTTQVVTPPDLPPAPPPFMKASKPGAGTPPTGAPGTGPGTPPNFPPAPPTQTPPWLKGK